MLPVRTDLFARGPTLLTPFLFALGIGIIAGIAGLPLFVRLAQV